MLQLILYLVFGFSIIAYTTLDGFDLGVGCLHLFAKGDNERRLMLNAIGPVWDGNTTWIVVGSGILFAGFPKVFSTVMSGLYTPVMLLLFAFMLRGAAVEFRSKKHENGWRKTWDFCFFFASLLLALNLGLILGNAIQGLPFNGKGFFEGDLHTLLRPYPILISLFTLSIFTMHGSLYLLMKTEGELQERIRKRVKWLVAAFLLFWLLATAGTLRYQPHMTKPFLSYPWLAIFALLSLGSIGAILHFITQKKGTLAFFASCLSIFFLLVLFAIGTFPYFVISSIDPNYSLTLFNSSATETALWVLVIVAAAGLPLAFFYGTYLYKVFRGKVKLDHMSY